MVSIGGPVIFASRYLRFVVPTAIARDLDVGRPNGLPEGYSNQERPVRKVGSAVVRCLGNDLRMGLSSRGGSGSLDTFGNRPQLWFANTACLTSENASWLPQFLARMSIMRPINARIADSMQTTLGRGLPNISRPGLLGRFLGPVPDRKRS